LELDGCPHDLPDGLHAGEFVKVGVAPPLCKQRNVVADAGGQGPNGHLRSRMHSVNGCYGYMDFARVCWPPTTNHLGPAKICTGVNTP